MMKKRTNKRHDLIRLSDLEKRFYTLKFSYESSNKDEVEAADLTCDYFLFLGVFDSQEKAYEAIDILLTKPKFEQFSKENFIVGPNLIDLVYWDQGFTQIKY